MFCNEENITLTNEAKTANFGSNAYTQGMAHLQIYFRNIWLQISVVNKTKFLFFCNLGMCFKKIFA